MRRQRYASLLMVLDSELRHSLRAFATVDNHDAVLEINTVPSQGKSIMESQSRRVEKGVSYLLSQRSSNFKQGVIFTDSQPIPSLR